MSAQATAVVCIIVFLHAGSVLAEDQHEPTVVAEHAAPLQLDYEPVVESKPQRLYRFDWHFKRVHWAEGLTAGVLGVSAVTLEFAATDVPARWTRTNAFDEWFQRKLIAPSDKQKRYGIASDALAATSIALPVLVDLVGMTLIGDRNKDVGLQMFAIQAQAFAVAGFVTSVVKLSGRERPCVPSTDPGNGDSDCDDPNRAFFSAHAALAFTAAGLTCVEHRHFDFFGRIGDPLTCAGALALAVTTGAFRVTANRHWMSDVVTGAGVGLVAGWLMPWLMHYRHDLNERAGEKTLHLRYVAPYGDGDSVGLSAAGAF